MAVFTCGEKATWETPPYPLSRPTYTISLSHSRIMDLTQYHSRRMHSCTLHTVFWEGLPSLKPLLTQSQLTPLSLKTSSPPPLLTLVSALPPLSCILASPRHLHHFVSSNVSPSAFPRFRVVESCLFKSSPKLSVSSQAQSS